MATDTESMHENMTRLRMRMVQQKLANERERLQRPDSVPSENGYEDQIKLKNAMLKRQELLDRIRNEQLEDRRPRTYTPRRRYTPSPLPPPSRRSLPDFSNKHYHFINPPNRGDAPVELHIFPPNPEPQTPSIPSGRHGAQSNVQVYRRMRIPSPVNSVIVESTNQQLPLHPSTYRPIEEPISDRGYYYYSRLPSRVGPDKPVIMEQRYAEQPMISQSSHHVTQPYYYYRPPEYPSTAPALPRVVLKHPRTPRRSHTADMAQVKHVIEHQFRSAPQQSYQLPPIQTQPVPQITAMQPVTPAPAIMPIQTVQTMPAYPAMQALPVKMDKEKNMFNKGDLMEMMMMQNAQMHHMVMQQMMLSHLPGAGGGYRSIPYAEPLAPLVRQPPSVYHHHIQSQPNYMPPMDYRRGFGSGPPARTLNRRPVRGRPYKPPAVVRTDNVNKDKKNRPYPFPGPKGLRRLRHIAYAAWFIAILKAGAKKRASRPSSVFLFGIILKEIVAALHRIYLNPNGNIYPVLIDIMGPGAQDLTSLLTYRPRDQRDRDDPRPKLFQSLQYVIENLIYHMTEIMPKAGVLGTHKKAAVFEMIKNSKRFPDGYFWQIELDRLEFDGSGRTSNVGNLEAFILMVGIFLSRSMITTLLLRPIDYGLSTEALTEIAERNIKVLATSLLFIVRRVSTRRDSPMLPMPGEVSRYVFTDEEMKPIHLRLKRTYEYCENLLREWGAEYIKRLRQSANTNTST